ncbi:MAG: J domain-containing protein [Deltaproteobacteria bacterium]|nr:J domain-containing protein [Deltaproteobacteria bacterium]
MEPAVILEEQVLLERARRVLGIEGAVGKDEIRYAYYRRMLQFHPDRHPENPQAHEMTALINEAFGLLTGRRSDALLLRKDSLLERIVKSPVSGLEGVLSYEEWVKTQFYNMEEKSIWPC